MNPYINITNLFVNELGESRLRYTITIPRENGSSIIHGNAAFDESIDIPTDGGEEHV